MGTPRTIATTERFPPAPHTYAPHGPGYWLFRWRVAVDLQVRTVYADAQSFLPTLAGRVVDVGAGGRPYQHLVNDGSADYIALDTYRHNFGYAEKPSVYFDGRRLPFASHSIDHLLCTEVLEHVEKLDELVEEMHRVVRPGGTCMVTIPWSARYHYVPFDYQRLTPSKLTSLFRAFSDVRIEPRGTDVTVVAAKSVVILARWVQTSRGLLRWLWPVCALALAPFALTAIVIGRVSLALGIGSTDDPLGYTVWLRK